MNPGPSDLKANVLCSVDPRFCHFMGQEFPASVQPTGLWIDLSNKQLGAKILSNRINNQQRISGRGTQETVKGVESREGLGSWMSEKLLVSCFQGLFELLSCLQVVYFSIKKTTPVGCTLNSLK